jgi:hypothetical protein
MNKTDETNKWRWSFARFFAAPLELSIFTVFCILVTLFILVSFFSKDLNVTTLPTTGGFIGLFVYSVSLFSISKILFRRNIDDRPKLLLRIVALLLIIIVYGFFTLPSSNYNDFGNPYLKRSTLRPLWTIVLPTIWIMVLFSARIKKFCQLPF